MILQMSSFGEVLISRPAGREAFLGASAYIFNTFERENELILDFDNVKVLAPSWADEFIFAVRENITSNISYIHTDNPLQLHCRQLLTNRISVGGIPLGTYDAELACDVEFLKKRIEWLDAEIKKL